MYLTPKMYLKPPSKTKERTEVMDEESEDKKQEMNGEDSDSKEVTTETKSGNSSRYRSYVHQTVLNMGRSLYIAIFRVSRLAQL